MNKQKHTVPLIIEIGEDIQFPEVVVLAERRGLGVTTAPLPFGGEISVTHLRSGFAVVAGLPNLNSARRALSRLAAAGDWDRGFEYVRRDEHLREAAERERRRVHQGAPEPRCDQQTPTGEFVCLHSAGHSGPHYAIVSDRLACSWTVGADGATDCKMHAKSAPKEVLRA